MMFLIMRIWLRAGVIGRVFLGCFCAAVISVSLSLCDKQWLLATRFS